MKKTEKKGNHLAVKMAIAMVLGLICGLAMLMLRENLLTSGRPDLGGHQQSIIPGYYGRGRQECDRFVLHRRSAVCQRAAGHHRTDDFLFDCVGDLSDYGYAQAGANFQQDAGDFLTDDRGGAGDRRRCRSYCLCDRGFQCGGSQRLECFDGVQWKQSAVNLVVDRPEQHDQRVLNQRAGAGSGVLSGSDGVGHQRLRFQGNRFKEAAAGDQRYHHSLLKLCDQ